MAALVGALLDFLSVGVLGLVIDTDGTTNSVTLWPGNVTARVERSIASSARCVIALVAVSCQTSAGPLGAKFARFRLTVDAAGSLLIAMIVNEPSAVRCAANTASVSGSGAAAETLTSPKSLPRLS